MILSIKLIGIEISSMCIKTAEQYIQHSDNIYIYVLGLYFA